ncbi:HEAT repeat domain-containing protein [Myxococcota bacterium]|nr:HEAT repeat domain-containing protein [Myxococcota bacterium]
MSWIAVAGLHTEDTVAALTSRAHSPRWRLRLAVAESLGVLASPRAAPSLLMLMGDEKESVRAVAAWALGRSGGDGALPALAEALRDRSFLVRFNAAAALVERAAAGEGKAVVAHARAFRKQAAEPAALGLADDLMVAVEDPTDEALRRFWGLGPQAAAPPSPPAVRAAPAPERKSRKDRGR